MKKILFVLLGIASAVALTFFGGRYLERTETLAPSIIEKEELAEKELREVLVEGKVSWQEPKKVVGELAMTDARALYYEIGVVESGGSYTGAKVLLVLVPNSAGTIQTAYHLLKKEEKYFLLARHVVGIYGPIEPDEIEGFAKRFSSLGFNPEIVSLETQFHIAILDLPKNLNDTSRKQSFVASFDSTMNLPALFGAPSNVLLVYTDPKIGPVYTTKSPSVGPASIYDTNGFYVRRRDGLVALYKLRIPFMKDDKGIVSIAWKDGTLNTDSYIAHDRTDCDDANYLSVQRWLADYMLKETGLTEGGDSVYEFADKNHALLKQLYHAQSEEEEGQISYEAFIAQHPIFFWKDAMGRWIKFQNKSFISTDGCQQQAL